MASERTPPLYRVLRAAVVPVVNAVWRPTVEGKEHIPPSGAAILASNHLSFLDSVFLPAMMGRPVYFLGKSDYFVGWKRYFFENVGVMPVAREGEFRPLLVGPLRVAQTVKRPALASAAVIHLPFALECRW
jgi:1-acyl-sn-glycerol-3-phosphate acyltransferase